MVTEVLAVEAAKNVIGNLVEKIITPKIQQFAKKCDIAYNEIMIPRGEHFEEYLHRTYKKYSILNTLVFKNERRLLKELYIPLTLEKIDSQTREKMSLKIDKYPVELVKKYNKILITDTAGMGKSTLSKLMYLDIIDNGCGIPIYIEARRLKKDRPIIQEIQEQINSLSKEFDTNLLLKFIQSGGFIFFFDGYDEISPKDRSIVTTNIQDFVSKAGNNIFILTSRPEQALASFGEFQRFTIKPLIKKEAYELLRKYDSQGATSKKLIDELKTGKYEMINDFLQNPLLVSLLFAAFDYKQIIPLKKHIFYRQVYDAYFDSHDLSKGDNYIHDKTSGLDIDDFNRVLRSIGYNCLRRQRNEFEKDELLHIIDVSKDFCNNLSFSSSDFLDDIISAVPLFCQDGQYYRWVHKSMQEYFAAQFIYQDSKNNQDAILNALVKSDNIESYLNLLDLYFDIDNYGFNKNITLAVCNKYIEFYNEKNSSINGIPQKLIDERIGLLFGRKVALLKTQPSDNKDPFQGIVERFKKEFDKNSRNFAYYSNSNYFIANADSPLSKILPLLMNRRNDLFTSYKESYDSWDCIDSDAICIIDIASGSDSINSYKAINFYLEHNHRYTNGFLDLERCIQEVKQIKQTITQYEKDDLTKGL
jgi:hypothetical protein